ncbi:MAG: methyltransferase [Deltaproteobacteria bacterium]|nr:methyltransferase [Deltaproteobacteria bacterium]
MTQPVDELVRAIAAPSYTPGRRDLAAVVALLADTADDTTAAKAQTALLRADGPAARAALLTHLAQTTEGGAARLIAALGAIARRGDEPARDHQLAVIADEGARPRARKAAAVALGKLGGDLARAALIAYWDRDLPVDHRRAVAEALGKVGGDDALARLKHDAGDDAELVRRRERAVLMAERTATRDVVSEVALDAPLPTKVAVVVRCRAGLEELCADELRTAGVAIDAIERGAVSVTLGKGQSLAQLWRARTLFTAGLAVPLPTLTAQAIARALTAPAVIANLTTLTRGPIRWRLDFTGGGHRRGLVWDTARQVAAAAPALLNDPTATTWDVVVDEDGGRLELRPRRFTDPRFAWRVADVPAASHPTIAAALARVAQITASDVVWDPFVGSGAELIECALAGKPRGLCGSDLDPRALEATRANLSAAGLTAELRVGDALTLHPPDVTCIVTNPPLGRRVRGDVPALLEQFVGHAAAVLGRGGRLVWITPVPKRTERAALAAGFRLATRLEVDLGGFDATLERWDRG